MSEIFKQAQENMRTYDGINFDFLKRRYLRKLNLKQGEFKIDSYQHAKQILSISQPELFGMCIETKVRTNELDEKIKKFADDKKLRVTYKCDGTHLKDSEKREVVKVSLGEFLAATPELFEGLGTEIFDLSTEK